ncbi:hypothetical protein M5689_008502 [Euphorbia peplus]|nr:hypothetical protein M5689_008502 [Euphorbia peplus]
MKFFGDEKGVEQGIKRFDSPLATKRRHLGEDVEGTMKETRTGVKSDNVAKESFFRGKTGVPFELKEELIHLGKHFSAAEFGNDEIIVEKGVGKGFGRSRVRVRIEKEVESEFRVLFQTKKRRKPQGGDGFGGGSHDDDDDDDYEKLNSSSIIRL